MRTISPQFIQSLALVNPCSDKSQHKNPAGFSPDRIAKVSMLLDSRQRNFNQRTVSVFNIIGFKLFFYHICYCVIISSILSILNYFPMTVNKSNDSVLPGAIFLFGCYLRIV